MLFTAVILARAGSKRLPNKNILPINGDSLIERVVKTAILSKCFCDVIVSTDSEKIKDLALKAGALVPFIRPKELSLDDSSSVDALIHTTRYIISSQNQMVPNVICLLQPTSPMLNYNHIQEAVKNFKKSEANSLSSMYRISKPIEWLFSYDNSTHRAVPFFPDKLSLRSQETEQRFCENGAMYFVKTDYLLNNRALYDLNNHMAYIMNKNDSIDIDTKDDFDLAEYFLKKREIISE